VRDVHEEPPAGVGHQPQRRQLKEREAEWLHRVGHHLLMADRDVDVVLGVGRHGDREQRRDRTALHDLEVLVDEAPLDVLRPAEVRLDLAPELREPRGLGFGQHGCRLHPSRDQRFGKPDATLDDGDLAVTADRIGREQHTGRLRRDHLLDDDRHPHGAIEPVSRAIRHGALAEQRGPALAYVVEDRGGSDDVQERIVLTCERCRWKVLRRRAGADRVRRVFVECARDRGGHVVGDRHCCERPSHLGG
jgi:hypothetical protein